MSLYISCKYPIGSRNYHMCYLCDNKNICKFSTNSNDEKTLVSAEEARQKTNENIKNCSTQELEEIRKKITEAIADGKFSISGDGSLRHETMERLKDLGYDVKTGSQYNEIYWKIDWK